MHWRCSVLDSLHVTVPEGGIGEFNDDTLWMLFAAPDELPFFR